MTRRYRIEVDTLLAKPKFAARVVRAAAPTVRPMVMSVSSSAAVAEAPPVEAPETSQPANVNGGCCSRLNPDGGVSPESPTGVLHDIQSDHEQPETCHRTTVVEEHFDRAKPRPAHIYRYVQRCPSTVLEQWRLWNGTGDRL